MTERVRSPKLLLATDNSRGPLLLVSVRSREEALAAIEGGADILDVKEPSRGSLGMASIEVIAAIARRLGEAVARHMPLSVALGEVTDWRDRDVVPALPESVEFAKLGLSRLTQCGDWLNEWRQVRQRFDRRRSSLLEWVAVAYADADEAASPPILDVLNAAIATKCAGLLIDTFAKSNRTLTDCCDVASLCDLAERCHSAGLFLALAGRLARDSLPELSRVPADVLAIRSAACEDADRTAQVSARAVASFRRAMQTKVASTTTAFALTSDL